MLILDLTDDIDSVSEATILANAGLAHDSVAVLFNNKPVIAAIEEEGLSSVRACEMLKTAGPGGQPDKRGNGFLFAMEIPVIGVNAASLWLLAGCFFCSCASAQAVAPVPVRTQTLAESAIYPESAAPAVVVSLNDAPIAAQIEALVVDVPVRVGDTVKAGAILVKLACKDFELEQSRLKAERQAIQARLNCAAKCRRPMQRSFPRKPRSTGFGATPARSLVASALCWCRAAALPNGYAHKKTTPGPATTTC